MKENCKHEYLNERYFKCALCGEFIEEGKLNNLGVARNAVLGEVRKDETEINWYKCCRCSEGCAKYSNFCSECGIKLDWSNFA